VVAVLKYENIKFIQVNAKFMWFENRVSLHLKFLNMNQNSWFSNHKIYLLILCLLYNLYIGNAQYTSNSIIIQANNTIQAKGEVVVKFKKPSASVIQKLNRIIYIDRIKNDSLYAYITARQFNNFIETGISFKIVEKATTKSSLKLARSIWNWDKYPTYNEYLGMMDSFAKAYPQFCQIENIGFSKNKKKILFCHINTNTNIVKPSVLYTSSMHGDETGGYILMLRLTDFLLKNYKKNAAITRLVDSLDIWINPLSNPDGAYLNINNIFEANRTNANFIDLNRNFPDPIVGPHPDGNIHQPENLAMMDFLKSRHFVLSANFHAGAEVVNYPWDCDSIFHADKVWFDQISKEYADSVQKFGRPGYFTNVVNSGYVDGAWWYQVYGGRQDYITSFLYGREVTIELDEEKTTPEDSLAKLWSYNI
jgi:hypothetical protein